MGAAEAPTGGREWAPLWNSDRRRWAPRRGRLTPFPLGGRRRVTRGRQEKSGGLLIIRSLMRYFGRVVDGRLSPFPLGGSRRDESGAQDAEKCLPLLTPHFAYGHEMSF
jgi:hypothetical protein